MEYTANFQNQYRESVDKKGIQIFWGRSGYGGGFPSNSLSKNTELAKKIESTFQRNDLLQQFDQLASRFMFLTWSLIAFFIPLVILIVCIILIIVLQKWNSRGVVYNFGFTTLAFIVFITAVLVVVCPLVVLFLTKGAKNRMWRQLDLWLKNEASNYTQGEPKIVIYHGSSVYRTIADKLEPTCVYGKACPTVHTINIELRDS